jgi:hypothetical protein
MNRTAKISIGVAAAAIVGLLAIAAPAIVPVLPQQLQVGLGGTIDTVPGTVDELFRETGVGGSGQYGDSPVTHAEVDEEYVIAASIWPWSLPPGWAFPKNRGVPDTPGHHWNGMGVKAAFSTWATASLEAVKAGELTPDAANDLLDEVEDATQTLLDAGLLSDRGFIARSVTPLRP